MKTPLRPVQSVWFDHVAIVTNDLAAMKRVLELLGLQDDGSEAVPTQGVQTHFFVSAKTRVELLEPTNETGPVAKYLARRGPGVHHLSFRVARLDEVCERLRLNHIRLVYDKPQPGAHSTRVNFIHPDSTGGVLIEVSEQVL